MVTDFTTLKAAAGAHYGNRSDLAAKWDLFTQLAEAEINAFLRVNPQQAIATLTSAGCPDLAGRCGKGPDDTPDGGQEAKGAMV